MLLPPNNESAQMKILPGSEQPTVVVETESKSEKVVPFPRQKADTERPAGADRIDFSDPITAGQKAQQEQQTKRIEAIKTQIAAGTYQVSSRAVAEKMLANRYDL